MPTYFFDSCVDGVALDDREGVCLPDVDAASKEAVVALYAMIKDVVLDNGKVGASMIVRSEDNVTLLRVEVALSVST